MLGMRKHMKLHRWMLALAIVFVGISVGTGNVHAAEPKLTLTPAKQSALAALKPLRGPGVDRALFDGRPLLVAFFASW